MRFFRKPPKQGGFLFEPCRHRTDSSLLKICLLLVECHEGTAIFPPGKQNPGRLTDATCGQLG
jgi:hypothetical protein